MAFSVNKKRDETKPLSCHITEEGEPETEENCINFEYYPNRFTPGLEDQFNNALKADAKSEAFVSIFGTLIHSWDVTDDPIEEGGKIIPFLVDDGNGQMVPNVKELMNIPNQVFKKLLSAITEDQKPKKEVVSGSLTG